MKTRNWFAALVAAVVFSSLAACGGGGGGGSGGTSVTPPPPAPTAAVSSFSPGTGEVAVATNTKPVVSLSVANATNSDASKLSFLCNGLARAFTSASVLSADGKNMVVTISPTVAMTDGESCTVSGDVVTTGPGGTVKTSVGLVFQVGCVTPYVKDGKGGCIAPPATPTPPASTVVVTTAAAPTALAWWLPPAPAQEGVHIGYGRLPVGCNTWGAQCVKDAIAAGLSVIKTSAKRDSNRDILVAFFVNGSGLWNLTFYYADDGSLAGSDISGGGSAEIDWAMGVPANGSTPAGIMFHDATRNACGLASWTGKMWESTVVTCL